MQTELRPPAIPQYWVSHAMNLEMSIRQKGIPLVIRQECKLQEVETFFGGEAPWEVLVVLFVDNLAVWRGVSSFSHSEGQIGYDRCLKTIYQKLNDDMLRFSVSKWTEIAKSNQHETQ